ncbi:MAG TPA: alpha-amylase family glycosyl hydrolase [Bryobacteraceae bacterium]|jgi:glycosidase|nr:alpha-amylase family glycosyl hydrolase [Bryobacteraceae bacterium]
MLRLICFFAALVATLDAAPTVTKIDPPFWWAGYSINPVRLLIRGTGLAGATVKATTKGIELGEPRVNANGTYLFVDATIKRAGSYPLKITTSEGSASATFEALTPLAREGRFQGFSQDDLIYLIMPDRFANGDASNDDPAVSKGLFDRGKARYYHGGDLQGVIDHLPYLKDLGVTAIWLNPVYDNANHLNQKEKYNGEAITDYHGYGAVDFYAVDEHLGDLAKLKELVDAAHRSGIKIILDMVANHTGPYHPWVEDSPTPTWFHGTLAKHLNETWQTWTLMDPHSTPFLTASTLDGWFIDILPDLNQDDPEVARYIIQNTLWWVAATGLDGIRQDTLPYVPRKFWRDWSTAIKKEYPNFRVVGEMFDGDPGLVSFFQGGEKRFDGVDSGIDALFDFPSFYPIRRAFAEGKSIRELATMLGHDYLYPNPNNLVTFLGLHDVARFMNEPGATVDGLNLAFTYLLTSRGIPMVYYGDEIGMPGGNDPDNRRDFPGGWKEDARNAFAAQGRTPDQQRVFEHVRKLAQLRQQYPDLRHGALKQLGATDDVYLFTRGELIIMFNNGVKPASVIAPAASGTWRDLLDVVGNTPARDDVLTVTLPARSAAIMARR